MECKVNYLEVAEKKLQIGIYPEWNVKGVLVTSICGACFYWNISRMECKVITKFNTNYRHSYWNISRMECKD